MLVHLNSRNLFTQKPERIFQLSRMDHVDLLYLCVDCTAKLTGKYLMSFSGPPITKECIMWLSADTVELVQRTDSLSLSASLVVEGTNNGGVCIQSVLSCWRGIVVSYLPHRKDKGKNQN